MCGIAGIIDLKQRGASHEADIRRMVMGMAHRGADGEGVWCDTHRGIFIGHRRLSIIDLSSGASQPMWDFDRRCVVVFNGEIYNFKEIKIALKGYPYRTNSDTEVLLAAYRAWGSRFAEKLNGIFTIALWDSLEQKFLLYRDQLGVKPLYYAVQNDLLVFASEIRAILSSGVLKAQLNISKLPEYFMYQSTLQGDTLVSGVTKLPQGHFLEIQQQKVSLHCYYKFTLQPEVSALQGEKLLSAIRQTVKKAVQRQMVSDIPVGAFLSGGVDSSVMVAMMAQSSSTPINTFTVVFDEVQFDESNIAREVANRYKTNHREIRLPSDHIAERLPDILSKADNPGADGVNSFVVSEAIKQHGISVAISGLGGDELFAGYEYARWYAEMAGGDIKWRALQYLYPVISPFLQRSSFLRKEKFDNLMKAKKWSLPYLYPLLRGMYSANELGLLLHLPGHISYRGYSDFLISFEQEYRHFPLLSQFGIGDMLGYTEGVLLKDCDQMSMASTVEIRVPFFDPELVRLALSVPDHQKMTHRPKSLLIEAMKNDLPKSVWNRKKMGFTLPFAVWMKTSLRTYCEEKLNRLSEREWIHGEYLRHSWKKYLEHDRVNWTKLFAAVALEVWIENNLEPHSNGPIA